MASNNIKKNLVQKKERSYLNRDFDSFRAELLRYSTAYYSDKIQDFSDSSVGGMFNDLTAYVGDVMSFYLDHQFNELNLETAIEPANVERQIRLAGVKITGAAPALCDVDFYIKVESEIYEGAYRPRDTYLPIIKSGTKVQANNGTIFELVEDLDYSKKDAEGLLIANVSVLSADSTGKPLFYSLRLTGTCTSGESVRENFDITNSFVPFRRITLSRPNISEILSVIDTDLNEYYEVTSLANDVVFKKAQNTNSDSDTVLDNLFVKPAPYRFITQTTMASAITTLIFGSGRADSVDDDIIPDPSEISLPLFGNRKTFNRVAIDPNSLLSSNSLGVSPVNTTLTITYRSGGGLSHNVAPRTIRLVTALVTEFKSTVPPTKIAQIRASVETNNTQPATGGEDMPTIDDFRFIALNYKNSQSRIVTRQDLVARVYSMPPNFGRVFRVGSRSNPTNPLSSLIFIVSRDVNGYLTMSPDSLKVNLAKYLNEFRLTSDAYDILDASIINYKFTYNVVLDSGVDKTTTLGFINQKIRDYLSIKNYQIDQQIVSSDIINLILNQVGVISLEKYTFDNMSGKIDERDYSLVTYNLTQHTARGLITPPPGGIFELKFPDYDIVGNAV